MQKVALIERKHCDDSAASWQSLAEEPREKNVPLCISFYAVTTQCQLFPRYITKREEKKNAIDEPQKKKVVKVTNYSILRVLPLPSFVCNRKYSAT